MAAAARGELPIDTTARGWALIGALALFSTVIAVTALAAGTARVGPSTASTLSTFEPLVATVLAVIVLDERLAALQLLGGVLVVTSAVIVSVRWQGSAATAGWGRTGPRRRSTPP